MTTIVTLIAVALMLSIAIFQLLLASGAPWGEFSWGGGYPGVLPKKLRIASLMLTGLWLGMAIILADYGQIITIGIHRSLGQLLVWILTGLLAIGTVLNLITPSKKEKLLWAPIAAVSFLACGYLAIFA